MINKKNFVLTAFLLVFGVLISSYAYALDVSIDRVKVNGAVVAESKTNLIADADIFIVDVDFTAVALLQGAHVEAILRGKKSGDVVSNSTGTFNLAANSASTEMLTLVLIDSLKKETEFDLIMNIVDVNGGVEQRTYGIKTKQVKPGRALDVSIDRVKVNDKVIVPSITNFIDESDDFDVLVEFTTLEDLEDVHVEAILKDLKSGTVIADASPNFNLDEDLSSSELLSIGLINKLKQSTSFELTVKVIDAEGNSIQQIYGLRMSDVGVSGARILDISIDSVEVENKVVAENENNFVIIGEGKKELDLRIRLTSLENIKDAHIDAILTFENGDVVADATTTFDIGNDENVLKALELPLIGKFEQNSFKLKVRIVDAEGDFEEKLYGLKISKKKFPFVISSISLSPESNVQAGKALVARLSIKNSGVVPLDGINAKVSIPELGVSSTKFFEQIKTSKLSEAREDFILKILDNVPTGTYTVKSEITSQFGSESEVKEIPVFIVGKSDQTIQIVNEKLIINVPKTKQDIRNDGSEVIYKITLTNKGPHANSYTLLPDGAGWTNLRLAESNVFVIKPKESKTINIFASTKANANVKGEQTFLVTIKSDDKTLKQIPLKGNVISAAKIPLSAKLKNALEIILIGVVVVLVAIGFFFGIKSYMQGGREEISEEIPDKAEGEAYY